MPEVDKSLSNELVDLWIEEVEELRNKYSDTTMEFVLNSLLLIAKNFLTETLAEEVKQQMLASSGMLKLPQSSACCVLRVRFPSCQ